MLFNVVFYFLKNILVMHLGSFTSFIQSDVDGCLRSSDMLYVAHIHFWGRWKTLFICWLLKVVVDITWLHHKLLPVFDLIRSFFRWCRYYLVSSPFFFQCVYFQLVCLSVCFFLKLLLVHRQIFCKDLCLY